MAEYAITELGVDAVLGFCGVEDKRSARVMEKSGMVERGVGRLRAFGGKESRVFALGGLRRVSDDLDLRVYGIDELSGS